MSADEEFEETVTHGEGGQEEGAAVAVGAPGGAETEIDVIRVDLL